MSTFDLFLTYFGAVNLILVFQYGLKDYRVTLLAGYIAFCVFYFSFAVEELGWTITSIGPLLKDTGIIYIISFAIAIIIYKLLPVKQKQKTSLQ